MSARIFRQALALLAISIPVSADTPPVANLIAALDQVKPAVAETLTFSLPESRLPEGGHLQGIQAVNETFLLSGSSDDFAYLIAVQPAEPHAAVTRLLPSPFRHAGGFQILDQRFAAVGIEDNVRKDRSKIWIIDLANRARIKGKAEPSNGKPFRPLIEIERQGEIERATAGAVALARVNDRHLLIVGTWDSATLDVYQSRALDLTDPTCQFEPRGTWSAAEADRDDWIDPVYGSYQNVNLIPEANEKLFLAAFCHDRGDDRLDLFEWITAKDIPMAQRLRKIRSWSFQCVRTTFQAGAGLRVQDDGSVSILACGHRESVIEVFR